MSRVLHQNYGIAYEWVDGHVGAHANGRADALASKGAVGSRSSEARFVVGAASISNMIREIFMQDAHSSI